MGTADCFTGIYGFNDGWTIQCTCSRTTGTFVWIASLFIVLTVFIKLFGVLGFALFLFYPQKWKLALYSLGWTLASVLIWIVIFNHKAESPTFVIAMTGVALWFIKGEKNPMNIALLVLALLFVSLTSTDLFPSSLRTSFIQPYAMKAFPCILIWIKIIYDMMLLKTDSPSTPQST